MKTIEVFENEVLVGYLSILERENYRFEYADSWIYSQDSFIIDPLFPLEKEPVYFKNLIGVFGDISPDRWGKLIQSRAAQMQLSESEYMLGVSDYFRLGALRLRFDDQFLAQSFVSPNLVHLSDLQNSSLRLEDEKYTSNDLEILLSPGSSLGGARPKASIVDGKDFYIAKFSSNKDTYSTILWEKTLLDLARISKINASESKLIKTGNKDILLVKRFDRNHTERIPFMSAMTLLKTNEKQDSDQKSYTDIATQLDFKNKKELFRRMVFNTLFGNTDDHLRNHALLYDKKLKKWELSPAFDLDPTPYEYAKQYHALNFIEQKSLPSIELCKDIAIRFGVDEDDFKTILQDCLNARDKYQEVAIRNGIRLSEIKLFKQNFEHDDFKKAEQMILKDGIKNFRKQR